MISRRCFIFVINIWPAHNTKESPEVSKCDKIRLYSIIVLICVLKSLCGMDNFFLSFINLYCKVFFFLQLFKLLINIQFPKKKQLLLPVAKNYDKDFFLLLFMKHKIPWNIKDFNDFFSNEPEIFATYFAFFIYISYTYFY